MDANQVINALGGTSKTAGLCGVTPSAVSQWRDKGIPRPWLKFLEQLRPDLFGNVAAPAKKARRSAK